MSITCMHVHPMHAHLHTILVHGKIIVCCMHVVIQLCLCIVVPWSSLWHLIVVVVMDVQVWLGVWPCHLWVGPSDMGIWACVHGDLGMSA